MSTIDLYNLEVDVIYEYIPAQDNSTPGGVERIGHSIIITSVICEGIDILPLLPRDQIFDLEEEILPDN